MRCAPKLKSFHPLTSNVVFEDLRQHKSYKTHKNFFLQINMGRKEITNLQLLINFQTFSKWLNKCHQPYHFDVDIKSKYRSLSQSIIHHHTIIRLQILPLAVSLLHSLHVLGTNFGRIITSLFVSTSLYFTFIGFSLALSC